jgi:hypothetical protein
VHQDIVYAPGNPVEIARADMVARDGARIPIIQDGAYILW